ncbi:glycosyltransferase family 4 protein [Vibrio vulnificus]
MSIAEKLIEAGFVVHVASVNHTSSRLLKDYGCHFHKIDLDRGSLNPIKVLKSIFQIKSLLHSLKPQIFHAVTLKPVVVGGIAARLSKLNMISSIAGMGSVFTTNSIVNLVLRNVITFLFRTFVFNESSKVIFQNVDDRNFFTKRKILSPNQCYIIKGAGVDLTRYIYSEPVINKSFDFLFPARLIKEKGILEYLSAAADILSQRNDVVFHVAGDIDPGNPSSLTNADLEKWKSLDGIKFWGHVDNMNELMSKMDVVVLPSYREGFPKVLIEASAVGRAIITTDVPGCRDAVINHSSGLLVDVKNIDALKCGMLYLLNNPDKIAEMGTVSRKIAEQSYDINSVVTKHLEIYEVRSLG